MLQSTAVLYCQFLILQFFWQMHILEPRAAVCLYLHIFIYIYVCVCYNVKSNGSGFCPSVEQSKHQENQ